MSVPESDLIASFLHTPAVEHALARPNRGAIRVLVCSAVGCTYTVDRGTRTPAKAEREHVAYVAALQAAAMAGTLAPVVITDPAALDELPVGAVVLPADGRTRSKGPQGRWHAAGDAVGRPGPPLLGHGPALVLSATSSSTASSSTADQHPLNRTQ